jgi:hypothetical protein
MIAILRLLAEAFARKSFLAFLAFLALLAFFRA